MGCNGPPVWQNEQTGDTPVWSWNWLEAVNGAYEVLVRISLLGQAMAGDAQLGAIEFEARTMLNSKTQPQLNFGRNTIYVGAGDPTESIVLWPDLQGDQPPSPVWSSTEKHDQRRDAIPATWG